MPIIVLGVYPKPMIERIEPSVVALLDHIEARTGVAPAEGPEAEPSTVEELFGAGHGDDASHGAESGEVHK